MKSKNSTMFIRLLILSFFTFLIFSVSAALADNLTLSEKERLYTQGTAFFHQAAELSDSDAAAAEGLYKKALLRFERLTDEGGVKNGKLFYNIGNIYFLLDDLGRAILNYRRAERYIPNDPNLEKNLAYARSVRQDKLPDKEQEKILKSLFFYHYDLDPKTRIVFFAAAYLSFWLFAVTRIFSRRPFTSWGLAVSLIFVFLFGLSLAVESRKYTTDSTGVILQQEVTGRQGDGKSYQPSFESPLHAGTEFVLLEKRDDWWRIELTDGSTSWIPANSAELVKKD